MPTASGTGKKKRSSVSVYMHNLNYIIKIRYIKVLYYNYYRIPNILLVIIIYESLITMATFCQLTLLQLRTVPTASGTVKRRKSSVSVNRLIGLPVYINISVARSLRKGVLL